VHFKRCAWLRFTFVLSQAWRGVEEARRLALVAPYGTAGCDAQIAGYAARMYE